MNMFGYRWIYVTVEEGWNPITAKSIHALGTAKFDGYQALKKGSCEGNKTEWLAISVSNALYTACYAYFTCVCVSDLSQSHCLCNDISKFEEFLLFHEFEECIRNVKCSSRI